MNTASDAESKYTKGRFLRGGTTSGEIQEATKHLYLASNEDKDFYFPTKPQGYSGNVNRDSDFGTATGKMLPVGARDKGSPPGGFGVQHFASRPVNMSVVWIMRVK